MKIRKGFISNSSSSSFIVISDKGKFELKDSFVGKVFNDSARLGNCEFGWENVKYDDPYSKINYAFLQSYYGKRKDWLKMLEDVIKEHTGASKVSFDISPDGYEGFVWNKAEHSDEESVWGYIDHQSCVDEDDSMAYMFESKEILKNFLFNSESHIQNGNDNE